MSATSQKLNEAIVLLEQAKANSDDYVVFIANLNAFVSAARSVTFVMQTEYASAAGFKEWYRGKGLEEDGDLKFFNKLRVDTEHIRPFNTPTTRYTTVFKGGLSIPAGTTVEIPFGRVAAGQIVVSDEAAAMVDGRPVPIERSTTRAYYFTDRPEEDAITLCQKYFQKVKELVIECEQKFPLSR